MTEPMDIDLLLQRPELFDSYRAGLQARREANRLTRLRAYWQRAANQLAEDLAAVLADGDAEIAAELEGTIAAFQAALASSSAHCSPPPCSFVSASPSLLSPATVTPAEPDAITADRSEPNQNEPNKSGSNLPAPPVDAAPDAIVQHFQVIPPVEIDEARQAEIIAAIDALAGEVRAFLKEDREDLTARITARALYCETEALLADSGLAAAGRTRVGKINYGAGEFPFAFANPNPETWNRLAEGYRACILASEALSWYTQHLGGIERPDRIRLLNAISARQRRIFRFQERYGGQDRCQNELFKRIMDVRDSGWLAGLDPKTSDDELEDLADTLESVFAELQSATAEEQKRVERQARKDAAVQAVLGWEDALEGRAVTTATIDEDRACLSALLDECQAAGVPPTNVKVRTAILETASVLLDGLPKYSKFLEAVLTERARKGLDAVEVEAATEEPITDTEFESIRRSVAAFTRGKTVLILGGKTRPRVRQELSEVLECALSWPDSEPTDKTSKFDPVIRKADIVLLNKNFCRHATFYRAKDLAGENGRHFIVLPSGYGVRQVVSQVQEYIERGDRA